VAHGGSAEQLFEARNEAIHMGAELAVLAIFLRNAVIEFTACHVVEAARKNMTLTGLITAPKLRRRAFFQCPVKINGKSLQRLDNLKRRALEILFAGTMKRVAMFAAPLRCSQQIGHAPAPFTLRRCGCAEAWPDIAIGEGPGVLCLAPRRCGAVIHGSIKRARMAHHDFCNGCERRNLFFQYAAK